MSKKTISKSSSGPITQAEVESCVTDLGRLTNTVSRGEQPLTKQARKILPRARKGSASFAREIAQLAQKYGVDGIVDVEGMLSAVTEAEQLAPLDKAATNFSALVRDRAFAAEASSWKAATAAYTMMKRMARDNADLARDLVGIAASLKRAKASPKAKSGPVVPKPSPNPATLPN